eukprot:354248-Chlamydomonas_euryale.AAC.4
MLVAHAVQCASPLKTPFPWLLLKVWVQGRYPLPSPVLGGEHYANGEVSTLPPFTPKINPGSIARSGATAMSTGPPFRSVTADARNVAVPSRSRGRPAQCRTPGA